MHVRIGRLPEISDDLPIQLLLPSVHREFPYLFPPLNHAMKERLYYDCAWNFIHIAFNFLLLKEIMNQTQKRGSTTEMNHSYASHITTK